MRIRRRLSDDSPDINFIPLIDVLLVIVIFLAVSTTFTQERVLNISLPQARVDAQIPQAVTITISADGKIAVSDTVLAQANVENIAAALLASADPVQSTVVIRADANATHQSVVTAMQAARQAGFEKLSLAAQISDTGR